MGEGELIIVGVVLTIIVLAGLYFFGTAMMEYGKKQIKQEEKNYNKKDGKSK